MRIVVAGLLLLTACGSNNEKSISVPGENGGKVTVSTSGDSNDATSFEATSSDGKTVSKMVSGEAARWPADAPAYAAAYPGATVVSVMSGSNNGKQIAAVTSFATDDAPDKVIAFYKALATKAGLAEGMSMTSGGMTMFTAGDLDKTSGGVSVQAAPNGGEGHKTSATVTFGFRARD